MRSAFRLEGAVDAVYTKEQSIYLPDLPIRSYSRDICKPAIALVHVNGHPKKKSGLLDRDGCKKNHHACCGGCFLTVWYMILVHRRPRGRKKP